MLKKEFMAPVVLDLKNADDPRDVIHRCVQALSEGRLVLLPTETTYVLAASALSDAAALRVLAVKSIGDAVLGLRGADAALDYLPEISELGVRFIRRSWPGPVTLAFDDGHRESVSQKLAPSVTQAMRTARRISLRVPAHPMFLELLRLQVGPLLMREVVTAEGVATDFVAAMKEVSAHCNLAVDDGPTKYGQRASVVHVSGCQYEVLAEGVVSHSTLKRLADVLFLFVCTGNTCRSPMAEVLFRKRLAERLGCAEAELSDKGFQIMSAGISAMHGGTAAEEAIDVMCEFGCDLTPHESQPLSDRLARYADHIFAMTRGHREAILTQWPELAARTVLLDFQQADIADPIGGPLETYRRCAQYLDKQIALWLDKLRPEAAGKKP
jgi:protein-tyrosine-phosphatase/tRNA A37 threonylcarbamoyladenosine synthetase subunit TsaC/SUA5/YrdC